MGLHRLQPLLTAYTTRGLPCVVTRTSLLCAVKYVLEGAGQPCPGGRLVRVRLRAARTVYRGIPGYNLTSKRLEPNVLSKNCAAVLNQIDVKAHKEAHGKVAASILAVTAHTHPIR